MRPSSAVRVSGKIVTASSSNGATSFAVGEVAEQQLTDLGIARYRSGLSCGTVHRLACPRGKMLGERGLVLEQMHAA